MRSFVPTSFATVSTALFIVAAAVAVMPGCASSSSSSGSSGSKALHAHGTSALLLVISDADLPPESFVGRGLAPMEPGSTDLLTVVQLPLREPRTPIASIPVPNAVQGPPLSIAATSDGRYAFITETRGHRRPTDTTVSDLPPGTRLTSVDLSNPNSPRVVDVIELPGAPMAVAVHPNGTTLAVACAAPSPGLVILRHNAGVFNTDPLAFDIVATAAQPGIPAAVPTSVDWHPSGRYLGITIPRSNTAVFYEFSHSPSDPVTGVRLRGPAIAPFGDPVRVGGYPYCGLFTPDGRYFITTDLNWNTSDPDFLKNAPSGSLSVVQLAGIDLAEEHGRSASGGGDVHRVAATVPTAPSPEGLAISRDGTLVAVACLGDVLTAPINSRISPSSDGPAGGVVHLYRFDPRTGALLLADTRLVGAACSSAGFSHDGQTLYLAAFRDLDTQAVGHEVLQLDIGPDSIGRPRFRPGFISVGVPLPPHALRVVGTAQEADYRSSLEITND